MDMMQAVGVLKYLEAKLGRTPSVKEIAKEAECSVATALKYLQEARENKLIVQRNGRYMSLEVAKAFEKGK